MSIEEGIRLVDKGDIALVEFDLVGEKVNKLSSEVMVRFQEVVNQIKGSAFKAIVLISRKKNIFIAGADIEEIKKINNFLHLSKYAIKFGVLKHFCFYSLMF